ncbi:MAG: FtsQ-type POTRA domain-containing protein [Methylococcales bacterium]|nr:FtsQ-type POTRA domain-containing protein [Methylococcales bacterium]
MANFRNERTVELMRLAKIIVIIALFTSLVYSVKEVVPIKYVRIGGAFQYISKDEIKTLLEPLVDVGFFDANVQEIQNTLAQLVWVESATVNRVWPDTLAIKIKEKRPFVRWGDEALLNIRGEIIQPKEIEPFENLPILYGVEGQEVKSLEIMKGVNTALSDHEMSMAEFSINNRWAWKIKLTTGLEILLGRNEQLKKIQRFMKTLDVLGREQINAMAVVDLRYPNGYAVSWKPNAQPIDWKKLSAAQAANR